MAIVPRMVRQQMARDAEHSRLTRAMKRERPMTAVKFEWHSGQTSTDVCFPSYGWVPKDALRWRKANGQVVPWDCGREGDTLLIGSEFVATGVSKP